jgi:hypothetical protein
MKLVWLMLAGSILSSLGVVLLLENQALEIWLGMLGPLAAALVTRIATDRAYRRQPEVLTALMIKAFAAKMLFFGVYIALVLGVVSIQPVPFVVSFTIYFLALHVTEAICLHRLTTGTVRPQASR